MEQTREEEEKKLKGQLDYVHKKLRKAHEKLKESREIYQKYEREWSRLRKRFEELDYELATMDGRFKVLPSQGSEKGKRKTTVPDLSKDQVMEIARKLNVKVDIE